METENRYFTKEGWYDALDQIVDCENKRNFIAEFMASDAKKFSSGKYMGNVNNTTIDRSSLIIMVLSRLKDLSNIHIVDTINANVEIHKSTMTSDLKNELFPVMGIENYFIENLLTKFSDNTKDFYIFGLFNYIVEENGIFTAIHKYYTK